jgi:hypothetical protein
MYAFTATLINDIFGNPASTNSITASSPTGKSKATSNAEFLNAELEAVSGTTPYMIDEETRLDTIFITPDRKMNYKYTLVNYKGNEIYFAALKEGIETPAINSYCTHPDLSEYRTRGISMKYHYFGSDGVFIGDFEASASGCL